MSKAVDNSFRAPLQYCTAPGKLNVASWAKNASLHHWQPPSDWKDADKHTPESLEQACTAYFEGGNFYARMRVEDHNRGKGCCAECTSAGLLFWKRECKSGLTCGGGYCIAQNVAQASVPGRERVDNNIPKCFVRN